jgi:N-methylhydantoinase A
VTIERGRDPRDSTLVAFGGSGPVHAVDLARVLEIRRVLVPVFPGVFTALGMLASDLEHHLVRAHGGALALLDAGATERVIRELLDEGRDTLAAEGYAGDQVTLELQADLRYTGQGSELTIPVAGFGLDTLAVRALEQAFAKAYAATYGYASDEPLELVNLRLIATGRRPHRLEVAFVRPTTTETDAVTTRAVAFARGAPPVDTPVVRRTAVPRDPRPGPLIVESYDSTVVVPPGCAVQADDQGNVLIDVPPEARG